MLPRFDTHHRVCPTAHHISHPIQKMIRPGLVSVTFRKLRPQEVAAWALRAGLEGIEWGGDIHVPHGNLAAAREAAEITRSCGLEVAAYGSYYRAGDEPEESFSRVLDTALALEAPIIRVWAGRRGSEQADADYRGRVVDDARRIAELAHRAGLRVVSEWHGETLTDTTGSARDFLDRVDHPAFGTYWQPRKHGSFERCLEELETALPYLTGMHVFHWDEQTATRLPLAEGEEAWAAYLRRGATAGDVFALLEFVAEDDPDRMVEDAVTLCRWLTTMQGTPS